MHGVRSVLGGERVEMNTEVEGWRMMLHRGFSCVRIVTMMVVALAMFVLCFTPAPIRPMELIGR